MNFDFSGMSEEEIAYFKGHGYPRQTPEVESYIREQGRKLVAELWPHQAFIDRRFEELKGQFEEFFLRDHDAVGRILKHHLILEYYLTKYLRFISPGTDLKPLGFAQKEKLLSQADDILIQGLRPGIREVNNVRNRFAHEIDTKLSLDEVKTCLDMLGLMHPFFNNTYANPVVVIEDFTAMASSWLNVDPDVRKIFVEADYRIKRPGNGFSGIG